jgi:alkylhydroperoxidase family enzyme
MSRRMTWTHVDPEALASMLAFQRYVNDSGLEPSLIQIIDVRASQINGCAY